MPSSSATAKSTDRRPVIYGILDAVFLVFYLLLVTVIMPSRQLSGALVQWALVLAMTLACTGMWVRRPWGRKIAILGCGFLLLCEFVLLVLILLSASYLAGVYGSFGQAASALALLVAALSIELVALLPALQLGYLMSRAGRRAYVGPPT